MYGGGEWTSLKLFEQDLLNSQLHFAFSEFFAESKDFFLKQTKILYDKAIEGFRYVDKGYLEKYKNLIVFMYFNTYLSDNHIFDNPNLNLQSNKKQNSLIENIFSVKNSSDKRHKVITILGIKIKLKRKKYR